MRVHTTQTSAYFYTFIQRAQLFVTGKSYIFGVEGGHLFAHAEVHTLCETFFGFFFNTSTMHLFPRESFQVQASQVVRGEKKKTLERPLA